MVHLLRNDYRAGNIDAKKVFGKYSGWRGSTREWVERYRIVSNPVLDPGAMDCIWGEPGVDNAESRLTVERG